ncbi:unnamed protein product [Somion occarium]|uniref:Uncharacterized protein n=1 Tax=Somion occarium TaxID=3059160 RepID=A0ABP1D4X6_9APHY
MPSAANLVRFLVVSLAAFSVSATPTSTIASVLQFNPLKSLPKRANPLPFGPGPVQLPRPVTNAQRMARGLPPMPPRFNHAKKHLHARQSDAPCVPVSGTIQANVGGRTAYVSRNVNDFGEYELDNGVSGALEVTICVRGNDAFDIRTNNGVAAFPFFGGVVGFANTDDNLSAGSFNYVYIAATSQTPVGSRPVAGPNAFTAATDISKNIESAIWTIDPNSRVLRSNWVNTNGRVATQSIRYIPSVNAFAIVGDVAEFEDSFGVSSPATFTFIPNTPVRFT